MKSILNRACLALGVLLLAACASLNPVPKDPEVKLVGIRVLPAQSLLQRDLAVDLAIINPNQKDLSVRSISYNIGVENIKVLNGITSDVPVLKAGSETPVTLKVSADVLSVLSLLQHFASNGVSDKVNYNFSAAIDFSAWLPRLHVDKKGVLPLGGAK
jgi:LEA14-like dessication related protein